MTKICFSLAVFFAGSFASACPNLTGTFYCKSNADHPDTLYSYSQQPQQSDWLFTMKTQIVGKSSVIAFQFVTDGIEREVVEPGSGIKLLLKASCTEQSLQVDGFANLESPNRIRFSEKLSLSPAGDLIDESINIHGQPVTEICLRQ